MGQAMLAPAARRLSARTRWSFGLGSIAYGIKDNGFATFLLLFYNQVIGLHAGTVGIAIMAAMVVEAFVDPLFGFLSDNTRSRWGRRHPWMYASALPVAVAYIHGNPPQWGETALLFYLFGAALLVRIALSAFEIPSSALGPELSADYDERTRLFSYRYLFGWAGGLGMLSLAYAVFLVPDAQHPNGLLNGVGYSHMAWFAAIVMAVAIVVSSWGLHPEIEHLPKLAETHATLAEHFRDFRTTIANKGFLILMAAGVCAYAGQGVGFALSNYMYQFVWEFRGADYLFLSAALLTGALTAFLLAPRVTRNADKGRAAAIFAVSNGVLIVLPYALRQLGMFPGNESPVQLPILLAIWVANVGCSVGSFILGASMLSDVVEESELRTGKRSEGVFFAGGFFVQKAVGGLGIFIAGIILSAAAFPASAKPGEVAPATIDGLIWYYCVSLFVCYALAAFCYSRFPFGRAEHAARLARADTPG